MDIKTFSSRLRSQGLALFSTREAALLCSSQDAATFNLQLHQWARKGWLRRLKRGLYEMTYLEVPILPDLHVANRLYDPSYVSLETALSHYQLLPETAAQVTSVTTRPTRRFRNPHGLFIYRTIRPRAFTGYTLLRIQGQTVRMAEPEKAVLDRLYIALRGGEASSILKERWDRRRLAGMNRRKFLLHASLFGESAEKLKELVHALHR